MKSDEVAKKTIDARRKTHEETLVYAIEAIKVQTSLMHAEADRLKNIAMGQPEGSVQRVQTLNNSNTLMTKMIRLGKTNKKLKKQLSRYRKGIREMEGQINAGTTGPEEL